MIVRLSVFMIFGDKMQRNDTDLCGQRLKKKG